MRHHTDQTQGPPKLAGPTTCEVVRGSGGSWYRSEGERGQGAQSDAPVRQLCLVLFHFLIY